MQITKLSWLTVCLLLCACGRESGIPVSAAEYGDAWPFNVNAGTLRCISESQRSPRLFVTLDTGDGIEYGLNGAARAFGFPDGLTMLKPGRIPADVAPFIERGLTLCAR